MPPPQAPRRNKLRPLFVGIMALYAVIISAVIYLAYLLIGWVGFGDFFW